MKIYSWVVAHGSFCSKLFSNPSLFSYKQDVSWIKMQNKIQIESLIRHIYTNKRYVMRSSRCWQSMLIFYLSSTLMILGILQRVSDAKLPILEYYLSAKYVRSWCIFSTLPIGNRNKSCLGFTILVSRHHNIINISKYVLRKTWMTIFIRATKDKQSHEIRNIF